MPAKINNKGELIVQLTSATGDEITVVYRNYESLIYIVVKYFIYIVIVFILSEEDFTTNKSIPFHSSIFRTEMAQFQLKSLEQFFALLD